MKNVKRVLSLLLCLMMIITAVPMGAVVDSVKAFAAETSVDATLTASLEEAKSYIDELTINNSSNDPATVVSNFGTQFTWDNEKRESANKGYLFEWSYYNGVVFEGLDYVYDVTKDTKYSDYVKEYLETMITYSGTWATCSNNSAKECAGYVDYHGADCYKTASLLLDYYKITGDSRYKTMAATLYADLQNAQSSYSSSDRGYNYNHSWTSTPTYKVWLDGLYMIQPFMAEYAASINDTPELNKIASRFAWIGENMYNNDTGLYYHAANSSSSYYNNSNQYWGRAIGWYAAAMVDVMDYMSGDNLTAMQTQFKKLVDGMLPYQTSDGMWRQFVNVESSTKETSVTALMAYAIMKAVNNGWLNSSYATYATNAFNGICDYALDDSGLHYICFKGSTSQYYEPTYDTYINEGKGVGPFIMLYAEVLKYVNKQAETPETPSSNEFTIDGTKITVSGAANVTAGAEVTADEKALVVAKNYESYLLFDISADALADGKSATLTFTVPDAWRANFGRIIGISVENGAVKEIEGKYKDGKFTFTVDHFSAKGIALAAEVGSTITVDLNAWKEITAPTNGTTTYTYTLDTNGVDVGKKYLIVNHTSNVALNYDGSTTSISRSNSQISIPDDSNLAWKFSSASNGTIVNNGNYIYLANRTLIDTDSNNVTIDDQGNGAYRIYYSSGWITYYLTYDRGYGSSYSWRSSTSASNVYLYICTGEPSVGTDGLYGAIVGDKTYSVAYGTSMADAKAAVQAGITVGLTNDNKSLTGTVYDDNGNGMSWEFVDAYSSTTPGSYTLEVKYNNIFLGTVEVVVEEEPKIVVTKVVINPASATVERDSTGEIKDVTLTYYVNNETEPSGTIPLTIEMLDDTFKVNKNGTYTGKVTYMGVPSENDFTLNVVNKTGPEINDFPTYPNAGSVEVDKVAHGLDFQNTGLARVELSTSGIPVKTGVDVVLVADISNSMAWVTNTEGTKDAEKIATGDQTDKWDALQESAGDFIDILLANNEDGSATENTISFVTFGGYDAERNIATTNNISDIGGYADSVQIHYVASNNATTAKSVIDAIDIKGVDNNGTVTYTISGMPTGNGTAQGGTNYDYAFLETAEAISQIKSNYATANDGASYDDSGREIYVVFMTDGAPDHYNQLYYKTRTTSQFDYYALYLNDSDIAKGFTQYLKEAPSTYGSFTQQQTNGYYLGNVDNDNWIKWIESDSLAAAEAVANINGVKSITAIGFDLKNGAFGGYTFGETVLKGILKDLAGKDSCEVLVASSEKELSDFYSSLAKAIRYAATNAYFEDQMGDAFELQMNPVIVDSSNVTRDEFNIDITVTTHPVYTKADLAAGDCTADQVGKAYGDGTVLEIVKFTSATVATSSALTDTNIIKDDVICAKYFYYNTTKSEKTITLADGTTKVLPPETFLWNIGTINETQFTLSYVVYLSNSMGEDGIGVSKGSYDTNNYATLYYENLHGNEVSQTVPSPSMPWGGANVSYAFYLVDEDGNPLAADGETITSIINAYKVTQPVIYDEINFNTSGEVTVDTLDEVVGNVVIPDGYVLYDTSAAYKVTPTSGGEGSKWLITKGTDKATTYVTGYAELNEYSKELEAEKNSYDYTHTTVYFAVKWTIKAIPDTVVIDFGLPVDIDVLANDMFAGKGTLVGVGESSTSTFDVTYDGTFGKAEVLNGKVRYTLDDKNMLMNDCEQFKYSVNYTGTPNAGIYYGDVTVIPATTVYYEDEFVTFTNSGSAANGIGEWSTVGTTIDATQAEDRPGYYSLSQIDANNVYGYDKAYENMSTYSMGSIHKVTVASGKSGMASFDFYGTGFDVISLTDTTTGMILVQVLDASNTPVRQLTVDTYYGMDTSGNLTPNNPDAMYQIPVMKVEGLTYGRYTVKIVASYNEIFDHDNEGSYDFYLDAIRIYDPANDGANNTVIENAYKADKEGWPSYEELRNNIISSDTFKNAADDTSFAGAIFIDSIDSNYSVTDYVSYGPNNEVYLANGQAVAFNIDTTDKNIADIQIALKVANGESVTYTINGTQYTVKTATDLYRSILTEAKAGTVTIQNVSGGILSITNIKTTYTSAPVTAQSFRLFMTRPAAIEVLDTLNAEDEIVEDTTTSTPEVDDTTSVPETSQPETSVPETDDTVSTPETDDNASSKPEDDTTSVPETSKPETEEDETENPEKDEVTKEEVADALKNIFKKVSNTLNKLLGKWFR